MRKRWRPRGQRRRWPPEPRATGGRGAGPRSGRKCRPPSAQTPAEGADQRPAAGARAEGAAAPRNPRAPARGQRMRKRWRPRGQRRQWPPEPEPPEARPRAGSASLAAGEQGRRLVAGERRRRLGGGGWRAGLRRAGVTRRRCGARGLRRGTSGRAGGDGADKAVPSGLGRIRQARYVSAHVSNIYLNNKKSDTLRIRIQGVSDTYAGKLAYPCYRG